MADRRLSIGPSGEVDQLSDGEMATWTIMIASIGLFGVSISAAAAVMAPKLPASAKKLTGAEISALFD